MPVPRILTELERLLQSSVNRRLDPKNFVQGNLYHGSGKKADNDCIEGRGGKNLILLQRRKKGTRDRIQ